MSRDQRFAEAAQALGHAFDGMLKIGGNYAPLVRDGNTLYVSGQIPRVGDEVVATGRVNDAADVALAQYAARVCVMRALALLQKELRSLDAVRSVLRITVFIRCTPDFTLHSEVADGASNLLVQILGPAGIHSRTSVGVLALPKNATVELDLVATTH